MTKHILNISVGHCVDNIFNVVDDNGNVLETFETTPFSYEIEDGANLHIQFKMEQDYDEWNYEDGGYMTTNGITHTYSVDNITEDMTINVAPYKTYTENEVTANSITLETPETFTEDNFDVNCGGWKIYFTTDDNSIINKYGLIFMASSSIVSIYYNRLCVDDNGMYIVVDYNSISGNGSTEFTVGVFDKDAEDFETPLIESSNAVYCAWENIGEDLYERKMNEMNNPTEEQSEEVSTEE